MLALAGCSGSVQNAQTSEANTAKPAEMSVEQKARAIYDFIASANKGLPADEKKGLDLTNADKSLEIFVESMSCSELIKEYGPELVAEKVPDCEKPQVLQYTLVTAGTPYFTRLLDLVPLGSLDLNENCMQMKIGDENNSPIINYCLPVQDPEWPTTYRTLVAKVYDALTSKAADTTRI